MVPIAWIERLKGARYVATYRLAFHILYQHWRSDGRPVLVSNATSKALGVPKATKWRALRELEGLGLITVERRRRKSPRVTAIMDHQ